MAIAAAGGLGSALSAALGSIGIGATAAAGGVSMLNIALAATVAGVVIAGVISLGAALVAVGNNAKRAAENTSKLSESLSGTRGQSDSIQKSIRDVQELANSYTGAESDITAFNNVRSEIISKYPMLENVLSGEATSVGELANKYVELIAQLEKYNDMNAKTAWREAHAKIKDVEKTYNENAAKYNDITTTGDANRLTNYFDEYGNWGKYSRQGNGRAMWMREVKSLASNGTIAQMEGRIRDVRAHLDWLTEQAESSQNGVTQALQDRIDFWSDYLYNDLIPGLDQIKEDADKAIGESLSGIITDALNYAKYPDISSDTLMDMVEAFMGLDWQHEGGNYFTVDEIRDRVESLVGEYQLAIQNAMTDVSNLKALASTNPDAAAGFLQAYLEADVEAMKAVGISDETIESILMPIYEQLGKKRDELLADFFGGEVSGKNASGGTESTDYDEQLAKAFELLEKVQTLRESINEMMESGNLSESVVDALKGILGDEGWQDILDDAAERIGGLNFENLLAALNEALTEATSEMEGNPIIAALGLGEDSEAAVQAAIDKLAEVTDVEKLAEVWATIPEKTKEAMGDAGKEIESFLNYTEKEAEDSATKIENVLKRIERATQLKNLIDTKSVWDDLDSVVDKLTSTSENAASAISDIQDRLTEAGTAAGALEAAMAGDQSALEYLANLTGLTADQLANNLTPAELMVAEMGDQATLSMEYLANMLVGLNAIQLDASGKIAPIQDLETAANNCGMTVAALANVVAMFNGSSITWSRTADGLGLRAKAVAPKITWNGGTGSTKKSSGGGGSGRKSGGGGGGGGSSSKTVSDAVSALVDEFSKVGELRDHRRELAQLGQTYHETMGEIQGVIAYLEIERDIVQEDTQAIETYVAQLEAQIEANRAIVTSEAEGSKAYNQAMVDLDKLQEEHQKYSQALIKNKTDVEKLTQAIKEQNDKIRQMEIDLENTILEAIEDREAAEKRKLNGRIAMEEEIMSLLKKRYEMERDEIKETQDARRKALEDELDQIDELLAARKKMAEQEDKMKEITELEAQIARITADPTRQKEALQLREKLAKLREDMAWDAAEAEAEAQKKSIKQQITSIEDYVKYVEDYYQQLLDNPKLLIEEMEEILSWTDEKIMDWLKKNSQEYQESTAAVQRKMENSWQETLDDMRDTIRTHWAEVETIIQGGADNIINFLTTYSQKYREASKKQAEAYVDEWKKQLADLEAAHRKVQANITSYNYVPTKDVSSGSGGGGGSSGGSSATSIAKAANPIPYETFQWGYKNKAGNWVKAPEQLSAITAFSVAKKAAQKEWADNPGILAILDKATIASPGRMLKKYALGGMNTMTGLAWLDGTPQKPERILSSYQTELFEDMINTLHSIRQVKAGAMGSAPRLSAAGALPNIDTINITIQELNDDTDYSDAAEKLMKSFYDKVSRTRPVGGIQGW